MKNTLRITIFVCLSLIFIQTISAKRDGIDSLKKQIEHISDSVYINIATIFIDMRIEDHSSIEKDIASVNDSVESFKCSDSFYYIDLSTHTLLADIDLDMKTINFSGIFGLEAFMMVDNEVNKGLKRKTKKAVKKIKKGLFSSEEANQFYKEAINYTEEVWLKQK